MASVKAAAHELEGQAIDLVVNNAAVGGARGQSVGNIDYDAWAKVLDVNTMGPMRVSEAFVDHVARSERKLIVTLTSGMGSIGDNSSGGAFAYRSSKAAVNMVMRSLAIDLAPRGITCVVVNPGWVRTDTGVFIHGGNTHFLEHQLAQPGGRQRMYILGVCKGSGCLPKAKSQ